MGLKITLLDGPEAGRRFAFGEETENVEIGRDPHHCHVTFPADFTGIGRRHVGFARRLGHYVLVTNLQNLVLIDGREAIGDEPLGPTQEIRLGRNGPRLAVETRLDSSLPLTDPEAPAQTPSKIARSQNRYAARLAWALGALALVIAAGFGLSYGWREKQTLALADLSQKMRRVEQSTPVPADVIARVMRSTYLVLKRNAVGDEETLGTAWSAADGVLATNAHVARMFETLGKDEQLLVRGTQPPYATVRIDKVLLHPDYQRFTDAWRRALPVSRNTGALSAVRAPGAGYDVALMMAEPGVPLAPPLEIASADRLAQLRPGEALAYAGFPMEGLAVGGVNPKAPVPLTQTGTLTAVTDYFLLPAPPSERFLVQHSLSLTGGASGSPVVERTGQVIGVVSGMNVIMLDKSHRIPNAAAVNFAQRADLVRELLDHGAASQEATRQASWTAGFATFNDPMVEIPKALLARWTKKYPGEPELVGTFSGALKETGEPHVYTTVLDNVLRQPGQYLVVALSQERADINLAAVRNKTEIIAKDEKPDWFPTFELTHEDDAQIDLQITGRAETGAPDYLLKIWKLPMKKASAPDQR